MYGKLQSPKTFAIERCDQIEVYVLKGIKIIFSMEHWWYFCYIILQTVKCFEKKGHL